MKARYTRNPDKLRRLLAARLSALDWTPYRLAVEAGNVNDQGAIGKYLAGDYTPGIDTLLRWLAAADGSVGVKWD